MSIDHEAALFRFSDVTPALLLDDVFTDPIIDGVCRDAEMLFQAPTSFIYPQIHLERLSFLKALTRSEARTESLGVKPLHELFFIDRRNPETETYVYGVWFCLRKCHDDDSHNSILVDLFIQVLLANELVLDGVKYEGLSGRLIKVRPGVAMPYYW